jgi:Na+-transporting NADH:ubiquinone oxidoreductase subunit NqrE
MSLTTPAFLLPILVYSIIAGAIVFESPATLPFLLVMGFVFGGGLYWWLARAKKQSIVKPAKSEEL